MPYHRPAAPSRPSAHFALTTSCSHLSSIKHTRNAKTALPQFQHQLCNCRRSSTWANIVGYSTITIPKGWSVFTPVFKNVDGKTLTLAQIEVRNQYGQKFDNIFPEDWEGPGEYGEEADHYCDGDVKCCKLKSGNKCIVDATMGYTSFDDEGWGTRKTTQLVSGEGVLVNNQMDTPVTFFVSGEVELVPGYLIAKGWTVYGNNTPVDLTLADIRVCNQYGKEFDNIFPEDWKGPGEYGEDADHYCGGDVKCCKLKSGTKCIVDATMSYTSFDDEGWGVRKTTPLKAGEALLFNNQMETPVFIKVKSPIPAK